MGTELHNYTCTDGIGDSANIAAESPEEAAQEYAYEGEWGDIESTIWIDVEVTPIDDEGEPTGEGEWITVTLDPTEPLCADGCEHEWKSPYEVLGGLEENPGVQGHGGGVIMTEVCVHCGKYQVIDTWAQNDSGEQGLTSTSYRDADGTSESWLRATTD